MNTEPDVISELHFFINSKLPRESIWEWYKKLEKSDQEKIKEHIQYVVDLFLQVVDCEKKLMFAEMGERITTGYAEGVENEY